MAHVPDGEKEDHTPHLRPGDVDGIANILVIIQSLWGLLPVVWPALI
jgi:hypothetical protein